MTKDKIQEIRKKLYLLRDGASSSSMREKGLSYKMIWGVPVPSLRKLSKAYYPDNELARELWKQNVRELKILATMIANPKKPSGEIEEWTNEINTTELAEQAVMNFFSKLSSAPVYANQWIQSSVPHLRLTGFLLYMRLFMRGYVMNEQEENTYFTIAIENLDNTGLNLYNRIGSSLVYLIKTDRSYREKILAAIENNHSLSPVIKEYMIWNI